MRCIRVITWIFFLSILSIIIFFELHVIVKLHVYMTLHLGFYANRRRIPLKRNDKRRHLFGHDTLNV